MKEQRIALVSVDQTLTIPAHIIRKNRMSNWFQDTKTGKWIHKDNLKNYITQKQVAARPVPSRF